MIVSMVTRYDVKSSRWSDHFLVKIHVLSVSLAAKVKQSACLCVIFLLSSTKKTVLAALP